MVQKKKQIRELTLCVVLGVFPLWSCQSGPESKSELKEVAPKQTEELVSFIKDTRSVNGCGCYLKKGKKTYYWNDFGSEHLFHLNGKDVSTSRCHITGHQRGVGQVKTLRCFPDDIQVTLHLEVTSVCEKPGCEFTERIGLLEVKSDDQLETLRLKGGCGC